LHTNTAVGAVTRLRDMGIEPFLLSSSLIGVLAQRLVRVLKSESRQAFTAGEYERRPVERARRGTCAHAVPARAAMPAMAIADAPASTNSSWSMIKCAP